MSELMPCPFCGSKGNLTPHGERVWCDQAGCPKDAVPINRWQERSTPAPSPSDAAVCSDDCGSRHCAVCGKDYPSPSREGCLTEERIRECRGDWLDALDGDFHSQGDSEFMVALCDMALSALRPAGDEGLCYVCGKPVSAKDSSDTCKVWTHSWHALERMRNRVTEAALLRAQRKEASRGK